jgi:hypothetical protein
MSNFNVDRYKASDIEIWNSFVLKSNQDTFLFQRDFMDYHRDVFIDYSLMIYKNDKLVALLPANILDNSVHSHQGLSYGGLIVNSKIRFTDYVNVLKDILKYLELNNIKRLYIKELPSIYNKNISEAWHYIAGKMNFEAFSIDSYFVIDNLQTSVPNRNRKRAIKIAESLNTEIINEGIEMFWKDILIVNLSHKHGVKPVHTIDEIKLLMHRFPEHIKFYGAKVNDKLTAGVVLFETENVLHFQYSSGNDQRTENGSLDFLFNFIIKKYRHKKYVSFGSSSTDKTLKINKGLMYWKESFGAKLITQKTYVVKTAMYPNLNSMFR